MQIDSPVTAPSVSVGKFDFGFKVSPLISHLEEPTYVLTQLKNRFLWLRSLKSPPSYSLFWRVYFIDDARKANFMPQK